MIKSVLAASLSLFLVGIAPTSIAAKTPISQTSISQTSANRSLIAEAQPTEATLENLEQTIPAEKWDLIQQLIEITQSSQLIDQLLDSLFGESDSLMEEVIKQSPQYQSASEEERQSMVAESQRVQRRMYELLTEEVNLVEISRNIEIYLYDKYYTEEDLENLLAFYRTPTGQKLIETLPKMSQDSIELSSRLVVPRMMNVFQQLMEELGGFLEN